MFHPLPFCKMSVIASLVLVAFTVTCNAATERSFQEIAREILGDLDAAKVDQLPAASGYGAPTIAIMPFTKNNTPFDVDVANGYNRRLLAALQQQANGRFQFVSRETVGKLVADIRASRIPEDQAAQRIATLEASSRADILITGDIRLENGVPVISYLASSTETARILASTTPVSLSVRRITNTRSAPFNRPVPGFNRVVAETENLLANLGYDPGPVDGYMTARTRSALRAYQADSALPVNGRMTHRVVENMRRDTR